MTQPIDDPRRFLHLQLPGFDFRGEATMAELGSLLERATAFARGRAPTLEIAEVLNDEQAPPVETAGVSEGAEGPSIATKFVANGDGWVGDLSILLRDNGFGVPSLVSKPHGISMKIAGTRACADLYYSGKATTGGPEDDDRKNLRGLLSAAGFDVRC